MHIDFNHFESRSYHFIRTKISGARDYIVEDYFLTLYSIA